jgi:DNA-binding CsgD family transcriptional regulator
LTSTRAVVAVLDRLYAGVLDDAEWGRALIKMADLVGGGGVQLLAFDATSGGLLRDENHRMDPDVLREYRECWSARDVFFAPTMGIPAGRCIPDQKLVDPHEFKRTAMFNELMLPADCPHLLIMCLERSSRRLALVSVKASRRHGPFNDAEVNRLQVVMPHVQRVLQIRDRLELHQIRAAGLSASLQRLPFGVLLLEDSGRIAESNAFAERLLRTESSVRCDRNRTLWLQGAAGIELRRWMALGLPAAPTPNGILHVVRGDARLPLSVLAVPLPDVAATWLTPAPRWLVLLFDPEERIAPVARMLSLDLGITEKESELCALLSVGLDLKVCAARLGIRVNTARNHLKSIFGKTGTHSQPELMRRLLTGIAAQVRSDPSLS